MLLLRFFANKSKSFYFFVASLGIVNSVVYSGILILINNIITNRPIPFVAKRYEGFTFLALIAVSFLTSKLFQTYMIRLTNQLLYDFELSLLSQIRLATYQAFEKIGTEKIYTAINDVRILGNVPESIINSINSLILIICGLAYLFWVSPYGGVAVLLTMTVLLMVYLYRNARIMKHLNYLRDLQDKYYQYLKDLLQGFKEIKMSTGRNDNIYKKFIEANRRENQVLSKVTSVRYLDNELMGSYSWYFLLYMVIFLLPGVIEFNSAQTTAFVITVLYLMGPVATLILMIPYYTNVRIALERVESLEEEVDQHLDTLETTGGNDPFPGHFSQLELRSVVFKYHDDLNETVFSVGPINLTVTKGEIVFVTGGNGSGKSTLINLLTGLYTPQAGHILLNNQEVTPCEYPGYRNKISAIFTNNYLFSEHYEDFAMNTRGDEVLEHYIRLMRLQDILRVDSRKNSIDPHLSKGQQKRLAMIYALMEKREVLVLDEWAAEQDPRFRDYFYRELLPVFQQMGKTIIAVTHDEQYFDCATRLLRLDYGRIVEEKQFVADDLVPEKR